MRIGNLRCQFQVLVCLGIALFLLVAATQNAVGQCTPSATLLPTGVYVSPIGASIAVGNMPLNFVFSPDRKYLLLSLNGWDQQGIQVLQVSTGQIVQTLPLPSAFFGMAFSQDGKSLYVSGGNEDVIYLLSWNSGQIAQVGSIKLGEKDRNNNKGTRFPAGMVLSEDGRFLFVAEAMADSVAVIDTGSGQVLQRVTTDAYPYAVVLDRKRVYVSNWGGSTISIFQAAANGFLAEQQRLSVGRHLSTLLLNREHTRLFAASASTDAVFVIDTRTLGVVAVLRDPAPSSPGEGSTPNGLVLSADGKTLYVSEADNNAVAVFKLSTKTAGIDSGRLQDRLAGRVPVGWYPTALAIESGSMWVLNSKGGGTRPNQNGPKPGAKTFVHEGYVLGQLTGTITRVNLAAVDRSLASYSGCVARNNRWGAVRSAASLRYPPFRHVIYIIKENRTYDQILGDLPERNGDPSLAFFPRPVSPNHHALALRFGLFDNFRTNAEVSSQGHTWSTGAYVTDYTEKLEVPAGYRYRWAQVYEGEVDEPVNGYLWRLALQKGVSLRVYGEFTDEAKSDEGKSYTRSLKRSLTAHINLDYPIQMDVFDQTRADVWISDLKRFEEQRNMPALQILWLPNDHTFGGRAGKPSPRACMADNDLALGRIVEALSKSSFWRDTVVFVVEDDAQAGPDHVDSHRAPVWIISPYNKSGVRHEFFNTTDVVAAIEDILKLGRLSKFDRYARPLDGFFSEQADFTPYEALHPEVSLEEKNPAEGEPAKQSSQLDFSRPDAVDDDTLNRILWVMLKGVETPYPRDANKPFYRPPSH
jgi:YVTN family beta-propeller protein